MILQVGIAQYRVGFEGDFLVAQALGSCLGVVLFDGRLRVGGMAHVLLPSPLNGQPLPAGKYAVSAVPALIQKIEKSASRKPRLTAKLVGGANMFGRPGAIHNVGRRNIEAARSALKEARVPITAEDVGGAWARTAELDVATGRLRVTSYKGGTIEL